MKILALAALAVVALVICIGKTGAENPKGAIVLTIAGDIVRTNRDALDEDDTFFRYHDQEFERAFEFDRAALEALGVVSVTIEWAGWGAPKVLSGPRLADVLAAARCSGPVVTLALDGFATEIWPAQLAAHEWVLSTREGGRFHAIGGRGPLWLVFNPPGERPATDEEELMWPWALFFMRCG